MLVSVFSISRDKDGYRGEHSYITVYLYKYIHTSFQGREGIKHNTANTIEVNEERSGAVGIGRLIRNRPFVISGPIKGSRCFIEHETLSSLLRTGGSTNGFERDLHMQ